MEYFNYRFGINDSWDDFAIQSMITLSNYYTRTLNVTIRLFRKEQPMFRVRFETEYAAYVASVKGCRHEFACEAIQTNVS